MKAKEIRAMPKEDLLNKVTELRKELIKNNAQIATGTTPKSSGQIREIKKTIARILTIVGNQRFSKLEDSKSSRVKEKPSTESKKVEEKIKPKEEKSEE